MGGLFAATADEDAVPLVIDGLASLAPHACDSSGVGVITERQIQRRRVRGPVSSLDRLLAEVPIAAPTVIGHTGRATLGLASRRNVQPHASSRVAVVQVGILENHVALRRELENEGVQFRSDTDSEVIVWLLDRELLGGVHPMTALQRVLPRLRGSFAIGVLCARYEDRLFAARRGAPLSVGRSAGRAWLASDAEVLRRHARESAVLEEGHIAELRPGQVRMFDAALARRTPAWVRGVRYSSTIVKSGSAVTDLARAEVAEQPAVLERVLRDLEHDLGSAELEQWCGPLWQADRILAVGCGDSYHAAHIARYWFEHIAGIPVELELSWELAARRVLRGEGIVPLVISSPETDADAVVALRSLRRRQVHAVALLHGSSGAVAREAGTVLSCKRGNFGTASSVAFMPQLASLAAAAIAARHLRSGVAATDGLPRSIAELPRAMEAAFACEESCAELGKQIADAGRAAFIGRGMGYPLASFAARRIEALSPFSAERLNGGEIKYRPGWRGDGGTPVIVVASSAASSREAISDARLVAARGGTPWVVGATGPASSEASETLRSVVVDGLDPLWAPFVLAIPLQLIACHGARAHESRLESTRAVSEASHKAANTQTDE